jgi:hypothetical protein
MTAASVVVMLRVACARVCSFVVSAPPHACVRLHPRVCICVLNIPSFVLRVVLCRVAAQHPWFEVTKLGASSRSSGERYGKIVNWLQGAQVPASVADEVVVVCDPKEFGNVDFVFSALVRTRGVLRCPLSIYISISLYLSIYLSISLSLFSLSLSLSLSLSHRHTHAHTLTHCTLTECRGRGCRTPMWPAR